MAVFVSIEDRQYDYGDEEKATAAVAEFQVQNGLSDADVITIWSGGIDPRRTEFERLIFQAVDINGSAKRARETVPSSITLGLEA